MSHPVWSEKEVNAVQKTHIEPSNLSDRIAYAAVKVARWSFDTFTLFKWGPLTERKVLNRAIFLETVAGVPGMVICISPFSSSRFHYLHILNNRCLVSRPRECCDTCARSGEWTETTDGSTRSWKRRRTSACTSSRSSNSASRAGSSSLPSLRHRQPPDPLNPPRRSPPIAPPACAPPTPRPASCSPRSP